MEYNIFSPLTFILTFSCLGVYFGIWILLNSPIIRLFIDKPGIRKVHQNSIPRAGGICIIATFLSTLLFWNTFLKASLPILDNYMLLTIIGITIGIFIIGFFDDTLFFKLNNKTKFIYEICIIAFVVISFQIQFDKVFIFPGKYFSLGWFGIPITILWVAGVTNSINLIDGIDGLAGSVVLISFIAIGILAGIAGQFGVVILCVINIALLLGFLLHNMSPARIFLGDTGSLFFGIILGVLTVHIVTIPTESYSILAAPLLVGFPVLDVFTTMIRRYFRSFLSGVPWYKSIRLIFIPDNEHIHHRLLYKGLNHLNICFALTFYSVIICACAIIISFVHRNISIIILSYLVCISIWFLVKLNYFDRIFEEIRLSKLFSFKNTSKKVPIYVINADDIVKHSLQAFKQTHFTFDFYKKCDVKNICDPFSTILYFNRSSNELINDIELISSINGIKDNQILLAAERYAYESLITSEIPGNIVFVNRDSLYIPQLLATIYPSARSNFNINAFCCAFTGDTGKAVISTTGLSVNSGQPVSRKGMKNIPQTILDENLNPTFAHKE
jgi:UDP-GlcNAc:undecaprenyl-phosphate GlcNAc-1-phosphate transferase